MCVFGLNGENLLTVGCHKYKCWFDDRKGTDFGRCNDDSGRLRCLDVKVANGCQEDPA